MTDFLDQLAKESIQRTRDGYYNIEGRFEREPLSFVKAIKSCKHIPIIAEMKKRSPSLGNIREEIDPAQVASAFKDGGAVGISVITEPDQFGGSLQLLSKVREIVTLPILMKDIVTSEVQVEAASRIGANAILLINALFERGHCKFSLQDMIELVHSRGLEILLETHEEEEFFHAVDTKADMIGINNRDLADLSVDLETSYKILKNRTPKNRIIVVESGLQNRKDLIRLLKLGANAFLIGSSIMRARDIEEKVKEFTTVHENC